MYRHLIFFGIILFTITGSYGQQKDFQWRLGVSGGYSNYYGDLTPYTIKGASNWESIHHLLYFNENYFEKPSFKISLERQLSPTIGLMLNYGEYHFGMSDRYVQRNGEIWLDAPNFTRGLNFSNHSRDMGLSFVFKADNDKLLSSRSWIAPYFTLGFGRINFNVKADLLDASGQRYDYSILENIHDGVFETVLPSLFTEKEEGYKTVSLYTNLGLGIRFRLGKRLELFAQSDLLYTFTDYLDDVSGQYRTTYTNDFQEYAAKPGTNIVSADSPYRGNPDLGNDWILYHAVGLKFNFGASKKSFSAPRLSTAIPRYTVLNEQQTAIQQDSTVIPKTDESRLILLENELAKTIRRLDSASFRTQILVWDQQIAQKENNLRAIENRRKSLLEIDKLVQSQVDSLYQNNKLEANTQDSLMQLSRVSQFNLRYSLDSISRREKEFKSEIDSIAQLKKRYPAIPTRGDWSATPTLPITKDSLLILTEKEGELIVAEQKVPDKKSTADQQLAQKQEDKRLPSAQSERSSRREVSNTNDSAQNEETTRLQQENQYLRYQRDQLLINQNNTTQSPQRRSNPSAPVIYEERNITQERSVPASVIQDKPKRRWWWPFGAAAGAVVATSTLSESQKDSTVVRREPVFIQGDFGDVKIADSLKLETSLSDSLTKIDLTKLFRGEIQDSLLTENKLKELTTPITKGQDTVYIEKPESFRFLPSKAIILFQVNQRIPDTLEIKKMNGLASFVKENEGFQIVLSGFADNTGNINYNLKLADDRMKEVGKVLQETFGLKAEQIRYEPGGQVIRGTQRVSNDQDRRVEARVERQDE